MHGQSFTFHMKEPPERLNRRVNKYMKKNIPF